ncbi:ABC transporter permease [Bacillaceae bacterium SAS-127]|uniref:ABC transporter permease n=1 Tax=Bacillus sp. Hm123 TaxID=3450745 RepID=UPI000B9E2949|nr:ABC transporter permease [Bacillaceae bacterium SAS-127]
MNEKKQKFLGVAMVLPSFLSLFILVIWPVCISIKQSFLNENEEFTWDNYKYVLTDPMMVANFKHTMIITLVSCVLVLMISYALAAYLRFSTSWFAKFIGRFYFIPMFIPGIIAIYGFINMYRETGWIARFIGSENMPTFLYDIKGLILMNLWFNIPFTTMLLLSALSAIPNSVIESARDVGAKKLTVFFKFILPLSYNTLLVALTFAFMGIVGSFTAPFLIDKNAPQMLGVSMQQHFSVYHELGQSSSIAVILFLMCAAVGFIYIRNMMKNES